MHLLRLPSQSLEVWYDGLLRLPALLDLPPNQMRDHSLAITQLAHPHAEEEVGVGWAGWYVFDIGIVRR